MDMNRRKFLIMTGATAVAATVPIMALPKGMSVGPQKPIAVVNVAKDQIGKPFHVSFSYQLNGGEMKHFNETLIAHDGKVEVFLPAADTVTVHMVGNSTTVLSMSVCQIPPKPPTVRKTKLTGTYYQAHNLALNSGKFRV